MIRCVRMWTGKDGNSLFEEGTVALGEGERGDFIGKPSKAKNVSFRETASGDHSNGIRTWNRATSSRLRARSNSRRSRARPSPSVRVTS